MPVDETSFSSIFDKIQMMVVILHTTFYFIKHNDFFDFRNDWILLCKSDLKMIRLIFNVFLYSTCTIWVQTLVFNMHILTVTNVVYIQEKCMFQFVIISNHFIEIKDWYSKKVRVLTCFTVNVDFFRVVVLN